jgi:toxin ParE1/3/4
MKVIYTEEALHDLDEILTFIGSHYPGILSAFRSRLRVIERRIANWPMSAEEVQQRPGVRIVPFIRYPYRLFYRVTDEAVEILHIYHAARRGPAAERG